MEWSLTYLNMGRMDPTMNATTTKAVDEQLSLLAGLLCLGFWHTNAGHIGSLTSIWMPSPAPLLCLPTFT